jgi:hypothetical protein
MNLHHGILHLIFKYDGSSADRITSVGVPEIWVGGRFQSVIGYFPSPTELPVLISRIATQAIDLWTEGTTPECLGVLHL